MPLKLVCCEFMSFSFIDSMDPLRSLNPLSWLRSSFFLHGCSLSLIFFFSLCVFVSLSCSISLSLVMKPFFLSSALESLSFSLLVLSLSSYLSSCSSSSPSLLLQSLSGFLFLVVLCVCLILSCVISAIVSKTTTSKEISDYRLFESFDVLIYILPLGQTSSSFPLLIAGFRT